MREIDDCCELCCNQVPDYDLTLLSLRDHHKFYCSRCFNLLIANMYGLQFEHPSFDPVILCDLDGIPHTFSFRTLLYPTHISVEALEMTDGKRRGYEFQVVGSIEDGIQELFCQLSEQINEALSIKHIEDHPDGLRIVGRGIVRGRIALDKKTDGRLPMLVIDGRDVSWEQFGQMIMWFKGCNFKMEIHDRSETR
jgi:hypothetical protein